MRRLVLLLALAASCRPAPAPVPERPSGGGPPDDALCPQLRVDPACAAVCDGATCWVHPRPQGHALAALAVVSPEEVWAAGAHGTVLRFDGRAWARIDAGTTATLSALHATGPGELWAAGAGGLVLRRQGGAFTTVASGTTAWLHGIAAVGNELWLVGDAGTVLRWDGRRLQAVPVPTQQNLYAVHAASQKDVVAVGDAGVILRWNGKVWSAEASPTEQRLLAVIGGAGQRVAAGAYGAVLRQRGSGPWQLEWAGTRALLSAGLQLGPEDQWLAGDDGVLLRWDGVAWQQPTPVEVGPQIHALARVPSGVLAAGEGGTVVRLDDSGMRPRCGAVLLDNLRAVSARHGRDVWLAGGDAALHWDGESLRRCAVEDIEDVWVAPNGEGFFVGERGAIRWWRAGAFEAQPSHVEVDLRAVFGFAHTDVWAVGDEGTVVRYDGRSWRRLPSPKSWQGWFGLWGSSPSDLWLVGETGAAARWDGQRFTDVATGVTADLHAVWGSAATDVWIAGEGGTLLRWDGEALRPVASGTDRHLYGLGGSGPADVWIVGQAGLALHWDGAAFETSPAITDLALTGVWSESRFDAWWVGVGGAVLRRSD